MPVVRILSLLLVALVAACGGAGASSGLATPVPSGVIAVEAKEYQFTPSSISVPAGTVTFSVKNAGAQEHEFEILRADGSVVDEVEAIVPGLTRAKAVTLQPGAYTFVCKLNGHDQLGMKGTLTVTSG